MATEELRITYLLVIFVVIFIFFICTYHIVCTQCSTSISNSSIQQQPQETRPQTPSSEALTSMTLPITNPRKLFIIEFLLQQHLNRALISQREARRLALILRCSREASLDAEGGSTRTLDGLTVENDLRIIPLASGFQDDSEQFPDIPPPTYDECLTTKQANVSISVEAEQVDENKNVEGPEKMNSTEAESELTANTP